MKLGIAKETTSGETRVALIPESVRRLTKSGLEVLVQAGAGEAAFCRDADYQDAGAKIVPDAAALAEAEILCKVLAPQADEIAALSGKTLIAMLAPLSSADRVRQLAEAKVTSFALDTMPRITRAQSMDVLSSMSTVAGYKAVLLAGCQLAKMAPMMMTAAGTLRPSNALVIGAGVAGLQAIATAKRIGAVTTAVDVRPAVREQIESLGAKFVPMEVDHQAEDAGGYATDLGEDFYKQEQEILAPHVKNADIIISTALIPGKPAPKLITEQMVASMKPGSVIVDLAAIAGGNCALSRPDETVRHEGGVTVLAPTNLPATVPLHASQMYAKNIENFLKEILDDENRLHLDRENEVVAGTLITQDGQVVHERTRQALGLSEG
jgi:NAD(P) transhydrogenase subunit alpha